MPSLRKVERADPTNVSPALRALEVDIDELNFDPENARLHGAANIDAIKDSLTRWGQLKPVVIRREGMVVIAGNGTLRAARELGWRRIAANVIEVDHLGAVGYGLADNRTAELASWDIEVVARLERLISEAGETAVGWSAEQIATLRTSQPDAPGEFPEVGEDIEVDHVCPKCGYAFSGGETTERSRDAGNI